MKNTIIILLASIALLSGCVKNDCKGVTTYGSIDSRMNGYVFKQGTYWIYSDTVDGIIDSQYVSSYSHNVHYRNPIDTPNPYYQIISIGGARSNTYCGPYYLDNLYMRYISYRNGVYQDTLSLEVVGQTDLYLTEHFNQLNSVAVYCFHIGSNMIGQDGYQGIQGTVVENGNTFTNVAVYRIQLNATKSTRFTNPTDLYFAAGYGIVKIVEHRTTGDVPWILLRYHIAP